MIPTTYSVEHEKTSPQFARAFAHGCGGRVCVTDTLFPGSVALFGSPQRWELLQRAIREGREWFYGDHAYFGRGTYYRITRNGYQHGGSGEADASRFLFFRRRVQPWRTTGQHVLICPNSSAYFQLFKADVYEWVKCVADTVAAHSARPVRIRWKGDATPIQLDLLNCWAVVVFSSASALDALIAGIPVFVMAEFASAYRFGLPDVSKIETPIYPDGREPFLWNLAANQWTLEEIRSGVAWRALTTTHEVTA